MLNTRASKTPFPLATGRGNRKAPDRCQGSEKYLGKNIVPRRGVLMENMGKKAHAEVGEANKIACF
jgi:hypothetical protein